MTFLAGIVNILLGITALAAVPFIAKEYPDLSKPLFLSLLLLFIFMSAGGIFLMRGKFKQAIFINIAGMAAFLLAGVSTVPNRLETAFSDHSLPGIVRQYDYQGEQILCSKIYVRGVYFYTGNPVIVLNLGDKTPFWSNHPLDVISTEGEMRSLFNSRDRILCVLTDDGLENLNEFFGNSRTNTVISHNLDRAVVLSEKPR